jgi:hypothetical protein
LRVAVGRYGEIENAIDNFDNLDRRKTEMIILTASWTYLLRLIEKLSSSSSLKSQVEGEFVQNCTRTRSDSRRGGTNTLSRNSDFRRRRRVIIGGGEVYHQR